MQMHANAFVYCTLNHSCDICWESACKFKTLWNTAVSRWCITAFRATVIILTMLRISRETHREKERVEHAGGPRRSTMTDVVECNGACMIPGHMSDLRYVINSHQQRRLHEWRKMQDCIEWQRQGWKNYRTGR